MQTLALDHTWVRSLFQRSRSKIKIFFLILIRSPKRSHFEQWSDHFLRSKVKIIYSVVFPYKNPYVHCFSANISQINMYKDCDSMNVSYFSQNLHPYDFIVSNLSSYISLLAKQVINGCVWVTDRENLLNSSSFKFSWQLWIICLWICSCGGGLQSKVIRVIWFNASRVSKNARIMAQLLQCNKCSI